MVESKFKVGDTVRVLPFEKIKPIDCEYCSETFLNSGTCLNLTERTINAIANKESKYTIDGAYLQTAGYYTYHLHDVGCYFADNMLEKVRTKINAR